MAIKKGASRLLFNNSHGENQGYLMVMVFTMPATPSATVIPVIPAFTIAALISVAVFIPAAMIAIVVRAPVAAATFIMTMPVIPIAPATAVPVVTVIIAIAYL